MDSVHLRSLINAIPDIIVLKDEQGRWLEANRKARQFFQLTDTGFAGKTDGELASLYPRFNRTFQHCMETDEEAWAKGAPVTFTESIPLPDGSLHSFRVIKVPQTGKDGSRAGLAVIAMDLTERMQEKNRLEEASNRLTRLMYALDQAAIVAITDSDGRFQYVNDKFCEISQYSRQELIGKNCTILSPSPDPDAFYKDVQDTIGRGRIWKGQVKNRAKDGSYYWEDMSVVPILDQENKIVQQISICTDITERKLAEVELIRTQKEVRLTAELQRRMLADPLSNDHVDIKTIFQPARLVSGDSYDYIWNSQHNLLSGYILDIMGHGLSTALQSSALRVLFHQTAGMRKMSLKRKLQRINNQAMRYFTEDRFAAVFCFEFDFELYRMHYASGGINHFFQFTPEGGKLIKAAGSFIGLKEKETYTDHGLRFEPGMSFLFMSDGLYDILPPSLMEQRMPADALFEQIKAYIDGMKLRDDATAVLVSILQ